MWLNLTNNEEIIFYIVTYLNSTSEPSKNAGYFQSSVGSQKEKLNHWIIIRPMLGLINIKMGLLKTAPGVDFS